MYRTEIVCNNFQMLGGRSGYESTSQAPAEFAAEPDMNAGPTDDDIPF